MEARLAHCSCGQLRALCDGGADKVSICHCNECRRRTGSAFGIAGVLSARTRARQGREKTFSRNADSGFAVLFHFLPGLRRIDLLEPSRKPDMIGVAAGAFADPKLPMPINPYPTTCATPGSHSRKP
ncbi:MAG: GFA family protein [Rhizomicrobium sp.]